MISDLACSRSLSVNFFLPPKNVAIAIPSGEVIPAHIFAEVGIKKPSAFNPFTNNAAVLLTGPPLSNAIIAPIIAPKTNRDPVVKLVNQLVTIPITQAIGTPITYHITKPTTSVVITGINMIGMMPCNAFGTLIFFI